MSSQAFDDFVAGDDRLSAVLRALPIFEAPEEMAARFAALAHAAQTVHAKEAALSFTPPASMEVNFLAEAARIQAAQQPRQDAVLRELQTGKSATEVLGHDVTAATAAWLAARSERLAEQAAEHAVEHVAQSPLLPRSAWFSGWHKAWLPRFGVLAASAFFGGVATHLWLSQTPQVTPIVSAQQDAAASSAPSVLPPTVVLEPIEIAQLRHSSKKLDTTPNLAEARPRAPMLEAEAKKEVAEATLALESLTHEAGSAGVAMHEPPAEQRQEAPAAIVAKPKAALARLASPAPVAMPAPPAAAPSAMAMDGTTNSATNGTPNREKNDAKDQARSANKAAAPLRVRLSSSAIEAQTLWQEAFGAEGRLVSPRIYAANPASEAVQAWAERFRLAIPLAQRPAQIRIEQDSALPEEMLRLSWE